MHYHSELPLCSILDEVFAVLSAKETGVQEHCVNDPTNAFVNVLAEKLQGLFKRVVPVRTCSSLCALFCTFRMLYHEHILPLRNHYNFIFSNTALCQDHPEDPIL